MGEARLIVQAYRFELDPSAEQAVFLGACCGAARFWFNQALGEVKRRLDLRAAGEEVSVPWSYHQVCSEFDRDWRAERCGWQREVVCGCYQGGFESLGLALKNFSEGRRAGRRVGFPGFRRKGGAHTEAVIFQRARPVDARRVQLDRRIGPVRSKERMSKLIRLLGRDGQARILRATLSRKGERWFVSFTSGARPSGAAPADRQPPSGWMLGSHGSPRSPLVRRSRTQGRSLRRCASCAGLSAGSTASAAPTTSAPT